MYMYSYIYLQGQVRSGQVSHSFANREQQIDNYLLIH